MANCCCPSYLWLMVMITQTVAGARSLPSRNARFLQATFDKSGDRFIAGDHLGNVFVFDVTKNRFSLVQKTKTPCTSLAFTLRKKTEFLVAMADYSLKCFDTETKEMVAEMRGHQSSIHSISVHASGRYALTTSVDDALLWDLDNFQRMRKLNVKGNVGITQVIFLSMSNTIITCFKDDSLFGWESDTLSCKYQLPVPSAPEKSIRFKTLSATRDGRVLAAAGRSRFIHLWTLDTHHLLRVIELPRKVSTIKQLEFLPDSLDKGTSQILGALCQNGIMQFINIHSCKLLFDVGTVHHRMSHVSISSTGRHLVGIMESGDVFIYSIQALTAELNKPPPPVVKVVSDNNSTGLRNVNNSSNDCKNLSLAVIRAKENQPELPEDDKQAIFPSKQDVDRLYKILQGHGEYPAKYRLFIWKSLLQLPENHMAYAALVDKGIHPAYERLHQDYPVKSRKLLRVLQRVLSALAHWSPILGETKYLPALAFPFVKLFQNNHLVCFEIIATVLMNWGFHWFEYFPNPPINILGMIENVVARFDRHLLRHLVKYKVTSQVYAWPLLESLFTEVLTKEEWLCLWDNIFSNHPSFLPLVVASYVLCARGPLLKCTETEDFKYYFCHQNAVNMKQVIQEAYRLMEAVPNTIHPKQFLEQFSPLTNGQYPVFNKYPRFIIDYQKQERERIKEEEMEYLHQRQLSLELQKATLHRQQEEEAWYRQQQLLLEAEEKRRKIIEEEDKKIADQRKKLQTLNRESKFKELNLLDDVRKKFLTLLRQQREAELRRLNDTARKQELCRGRELEAALTEAEIRNMEMDLQKGLHEQEILRDFIQSSQILKSNEVCHKNAELEEKITQTMSPKDNRNWDYLQENNSEMAKRRQKMQDNCLQDEWLEQTGVPLEDNGRMKYCIHDAEKMIYGGDIHESDTALNHEQMYETEKIETGHTDPILFKRDRKVVNKAAAFMDEIRQLRQRLALESRNIKPPSVEK